MAAIQVKDKLFELFIPEDKILGEVQRVADQISNDMRNENPLFICVLNGAFMFASDLIKRLDFPCEVTFIRLKSYLGTSSGGQVKEIHGLIEPVTGRNVVIIEDIIDTGHTINQLIHTISKDNPASLKVATLLFKPEALKIEISPDYVAMNIPPDFIVGYGLDYDGHGRNLRDIYRIKG
ncbi:MAG: hypoxanthine phosphoribosyltransferase [Dysgonamonadaceae bacterium]|jgi:hypoxanthine phosphoribosyltransferase|nr:hypoxanthine phosphoribosyltransferase [Dysgonamonadaceae bacterium]